MDDLNEIPDSQIQTPVEANPDAVEVTETPEYEPNYKFKVKNDEFEFDERIRSGITSKEAEDHLRDIYTRSHGLDSVKARAEEYEKNYKDTESKYGQLHSQYEQVQNGITRLNELREKDFATFQKAWQIPDQKVLERAAEIMGAINDPNAYNALQKRDEDRVQMLLFEQQRKQESQASNQMQRQLHEMKLQHVMSSPDIQQFSKDFDRKMGEGSFQKEINNLGQLEWAQGRYLEPQAAVAQVHQRFKNFITAEQQAVQQTQQRSNGDIEVKPIPNMGSGRTGAPVKKKFKTLDDLRNYAKTLD